MTKYLFLVVSLITNMALAQSYQLGQAIFSGNGCNSKNTSVATSFDLQSISILFDDFGVDVQGSYGKDRTFKTTCIVNIPVKVTPGYMVETATVDYRGFADLAGYSVGSILTYSSRTDYMAGPKAGRGSVMNGPYTDAFFSRVVVKQNPGYKKCPVVNTIYLAITAQVNSGAKNSRGLVTLDSSDIADGGVRMGISLRPCQK